PGRPGRRAPAHRRVLPSRVVRPVRALPRRHRAAGGAAGAAACRPSARLARAGGGAPPRARAGHARRLHLRPRPDRLDGDRVGPRAPRRLSAAERDGRQPVTDLISFDPSPPPSRVPQATPREERRRVALEINAQPLEAEAGAPLLDACRAAGIEVPTLCFLETLTPVNACRLCVVELEGARSLVP